MRRTKERAEFAERWLQVAATTHKPNAVLASEMGVPVRTVQRWTSEARLQGLIPATKSGSTGQRRPLHNPRCPTCRCYE